jgi:hypothetical protein
MQMTGLDSNEAEEKYTVDEVLLTHSTWISMNRRCGGKSKNPHELMYVNIKIFQPWTDSFERFIRDVGPRPSSEYTLDRYPDGKGDYMPNNVRWATKKQQGINRRSTRLITYNNETLCISDWVRKTGIPRAALTKRLDDGWPVEKAFTEPTNPSAAKGFLGGFKKGRSLTLEQVYEILDKAKSGNYNLAELSKEYGVTTSCISNVTKKFNVKIMKRRDKKL